MNEKGFGLIEFLVSMAIVGMVMGAVAPSIYLVMWSPSHINNQTVALTDVNFAALPIKEHIRMAQSTNLTDGDPVPRGSVTLTWTDYSSFDLQANRNHSSALSLSGTQLLRNYDGTVQTVGRYISNLGFTQVGRVVTVTITSSPPEVPQRSKTLVFQVLLRPVPPP